MLPKKGCDKWPSPLPPLPLRRERESRDAASSTWEHLGPRRDIGPRPADEGGQRQRAKIFAAAQTDGDRAGGLFFVADYKHIRNFLQLRAANLGLHAVLAFIQLDPQPGFL